MFEIGAKRYGAGFSGDFPAPVFVDPIRGGKNNPREQSDHGSSASERSKIVSRCVGFLSLRASLSMS